MSDEYIYQNKVFINRRKELRNNSTEAEKILWENIKHSKLGGFKFTRQYSVGPYILDFYCSKIRLAVELDGNQHKEKDAVLYDGDRSKYLDGANIKVIRFWNDEVVKNTKIILNQILKQAVELANPLLR
jgi:very-short-patch-repair endonuclease